VGGRKAEVRILLLRLFAVILGLEVVMVTQIEKDQRLRVLMSEISELELFIMTWDVGGPRYNKLPKGAKAIPEAVRGDVMKSAVAITRQKRDAVLDVFRRLNKEE